MKLRSLGRRRIVALLTAGLVATSGIVWAASPGVALPACPIQGNFEIDGDMQQGTCSPPGDDWGTPGLGVQVSSQGGTYSTSSKDTDPTSGWSSSGSTPDKTDFTRAYAFARVVGGDYFAYVAWERTSTSGTQGYVIEIDNAPIHVKASDNTPQPDRSKGGYVFYISSQGSAAPTFAGDCTFTDQTSYAAQNTCSNSQAGFEGAFNSSPINDPLNSNASVAIGGFYEISLNITELTGIAPSCPGSEAASLYLRSVTGQVTNGNLKGYMAPVTLQPNSTCVTPPITTTATPGNGTIDGVAGVAEGSAQHDTVVVGTGAAPGVGTVQFFLCQPSVVNDNGGDCSKNGDAIGSAVTLDSGGNGTSTPDVSGLTTPNDNTPGKYCWRAEFTPSASDTHYLPGSETNGDTSGPGAECFNVLHASPTITTQAGDTGNEPGTLGLSTMTDTATLHDFLGDISGQTVSFDLFGPFAPGVTPSCLSGPNEPVFTTSGTLNGSGQATTSPGYTPTSAGTYVWVAHYNGDSINAGVDGSCTDANESETIIGPVLTVTKSANPVGPVTAGDTIGFDITLANTPAASATNVVISDVLPLGGGDLSWSVVPSFPGCSFSVNGSGHQVLTCSLGTVAKGATIGPIHVQTATTSADCATISNTASFTSDNGGTGNSTASVTVNCLPNLTFTKSPDDATVSAGSQIGFTVTVSNSSAAGTGTANNVVISDPLPMGPSGSGVDWSLLSGSPNCSVTGTAPAQQTLSCTTVDLAPGASETAHVVSATSFASCALYHNDAELTADNNATLHRTADTTVQCPDVTQTKTADPNPVSAGDDIGFTLTVSNSDATGTGMATGVQLSDPLPTGPGISWSIDPANPGTNCGISSNTLTCNVGTMAPGDSMSVHVTSPTVFASCNIYDNTAHVTVTNEPGVADAQASTEVDCPDPNIMKTADADTVSAGQSIGFTITASNADVEGTGIARGIAISDPLPGGSGVDWQLDTGSPPNCSITGTPPTQTLTCTATDLDAGSSESVHVTSTTVFASCGVYDNTATLSLTNGPVILPTALVADVVGTPEVFTSEATTTVDCPALGLTKTADAASVNSGDAIGFTIGATNTGAGVAFGAVIQDPLPAHPGVHWSVSPAYTGPGTCAIAGPDGHQVLTCELGDFAAGGEATVHVTSDTTSQSCGPYDNTASLVSGNAPGASASATTTVNCAAVLPVPPLATTGSGPINTEFLWAGAMVVLGLLLTLLGRRRRTETD